jgi:steroid delta-isomerase-like uncharacterized protein
MIPTLHALSVTEAFAMNSNVNRARRWFDEVWNQRRTDVIPELVASDCLGHHEDRTTTGSAQWLELYRQILDAFPDLHVTVEDAIGEADQVVVRWRMSGKHQGNFAGVDATKRPIDVHGMTWLRFGDGRIVEGWDSWNQGGLIAYLRGAVSGQRLTSLA